MTETARESFDLERDKRWHLKTHIARVCRTPGCLTYVLDKRDRYCLACQLDRCEQPGCTREVQTWCPLCEKLLCLEHDPLTPSRRHDCLAGPAVHLRARGHALR